MKQFVFFNGDKKEKNPKQSALRNCGRKVRLLEPKYGKDGFYPKDSILIITCLGSHNRADPGVYFATEECDFKNRMFEVELGDYGWVFEDDYQANLPYVNKFVSYEHMKGPHDVKGRKVKLLEDKKCYWGYYPAGSILTICAVGIDNDRSVIYLASAEGFESDEVGLGDVGWEFID